MRLVGDEEGDIDTGIFREFAGRLSSSEDPKLGIRVKPRKGFQGFVNEQADGWIEEPRRMLAEIGPLLKIGDFLANDDNKEQFPSAHAYSDKIGEAFTTAVRGRAREDLTKEYLEEWFSIIDDVTAPGSVPGETERREQAAQETHDMTRQLTEKFGKDAMLALRVITRSEVLSSTLINLANKNPDKFVERLYTLGTRGLDPENELAFTITFNIMEKMFEKSPMVRCALASYPTPVAAHKPDLQQKAIDLLLTLEAAGFSSEHIHNASELHKLSSRERLLLVKTFRGANPDELPKHSDIAARYKSFTQDAYAEATGRPTTLYGRLMEYKDSKAPAPVRSFKRIRRRLLS